MIKQFVKWCRSDVETRSEPKIIPKNEHALREKDICKNALSVLKKLNTSDFSAYLVGGGVRDVLAGYIPKDFDLVTDAKPEQVKNLFRRSLLIGRRFRLVHVRFGRDIVEVATFRGRDKGMSRKRRLSREGMILRDNIYGNIDDDAYRRDFTVNAIYYNAADGSLVDYADGIEDIAKKQIRMIGDPEKRYQEDPVRLLRAIRLAAKLHFAIEAETAEPIQKLSRLIEDVSADRLFIEVVKLFYTGCGQKVYTMLREYGVFARLFPDTQACLKGENCEQHVMLMQALYNADKRFKQGLPLSSAFIFAVLLWGPLQSVLAAREGKKESFNIKLDKAMAEVLQRQQMRVAVPKRVSENVRLIWSMQYRFERRTKESVGRLLGHPRFRAAYDFLLLRAQIGDSVWLAQWWQQYYDAKEDKRVRMLEKVAKRMEKDNPKSKNSPRRRSRRSGNQKPDAQKSTS